MRYQLSGRRDSRMSIHREKYIIYSVRLSVHEDVTPRGVNPPLQLLLPLEMRGRMQSEREGCPIETRTLFLFFFAVNARAALPLESPSSMLILGGSLFYSRTITERPGLNRTGRRQPERPVRAETKRMAQG
jgi:hypothetical protein